MQRPGTLFYFLTPRVFLFCGTHTEMGQQAWPRELETVLAANHQPVSYQLRIGTPLLLYPTGAWRARQKQKTNLPASTIRIQTPFCPSSTCAHPLLKDFIYLCAGLAPYRQLCTSKSLYLSFYNSILKLVCLLDVDPKEKKHLIK